MNFRSGVSGLGKGAVCSAAAEGNTVKALIKQGGAIRLVSVDLVTKAMKNHGVVSLADECFLTSTGRIERMGETYYVGN